MNSRTLKENWNHVKRQTWWIWEKTQKSPSYSLKLPYIYRNIVPSIVILGHNTTTIRQFWSLYFDFCFQNYHLGTVSFRIYCLIWRQLFVIKILFVSPSYTKRCFFGIQTSPRCPLGRLIWLKTWYFHNNIILDLENLFPISSNEPFEKRVFFVSFQQGITNWNSNRHIPWC